MCVGYNPALDIFGFRALTLDSLAKHLCLGLQAPSFDAVRSCARGLRLQPVV